MEKRRQALTFRRGHPASIELDRKIDELMSRKTARKSFSAPVAALRRN